MSWWGLTPPPPDRYVQYYGECLSRYVWITVCLCVYPQAYLKNHMSRPPDFYARCLHVAPARSPGDIVIRYIGYFRFCE